MIVVKANQANHTIELGMQGENESRVVHVRSIEEWKTDFGDGTAFLAYARPGAKTPYLVEIEVVDNVVQWVPNNADTAKNGTGFAQLSYCIGNKNVKSETYKVFVGESIFEDPNPPAGEDNWLEKIQKESMKAIEAAAQAEQAKAKAEAANGESLQNAQVASGASAEAVKAKEDSELAAKQAKESASQYPKIINGTWWVWDAVKGDYADTGVSANAGVKNYIDLTNKPQINSVELSSNKTLEELGIQPKGDYLTEESDPTVPAWAKQPSKPAYTADEVGAEKKGTASKAITQHNTSPDAHADIRALIQAQIDRLNTLANSDDETLDQMQEVVAYIKNNRDLIEQVTSGKVNVGDIIDNLTTSDAKKPLSAKMGVELKRLIDGIDVPTRVSQLTNDAEFVTADKTITRLARDSELNMDALPAFSEINYSVGTSPMPAPAIKLGEHVFGCKTISNVQLCFTNDVSGRTGRVFYRSYAAGWNEWVDLTEKGVTPEQVKAWDAKLSQSDLQGGIDTALAQAKESGAFDGKDAEFTPEIKQEIAALVEVPKVVQTSGDSTKDVMSQKAVKDYMIESICPEFTGTGPIVSAPLFKDSNIHTVLNFEPIQEGEGDPSPENMRPIKARTSVDGVHCGKNLLDDKFVGYYDNNIRAYEKGVFLDSNGFLLKAGETYTLASSTKSGTTFIYDFESKSTLAKSPSGQVEFSPQYDVLASFNVYWSSGTPQGAKITLTVGPTPTPYAPYHGENFTVNLGQEVYGGSVDLETGETQKTWQTESKIASNFYIVADRYWESDLSISAPSSSVPPNKTGEKCNLAKIGNGDKFPEETYAWAYDKKLRISKATYTAMTRGGLTLEICYPIAEPVPFALSPDQLVKLRAYGNGDTVYTSDLACNVTLNGYSDPKALLAELKPKVDEAAKAQAGIVSAYREGVNNA